MKGQITRFDIFFGNSDDNSIREKFEEELGQSGDDHGIFSGDGSHANLPEGVETDEQKTDFSRKILKLFREYEARGEAIAGSAVFMVVDIEEAEKILKS